ncbi:kinase-like domain-containing protein [Parachaetomium inaequale]|uniref:Kinase-like domain-containing protein n=1 Tax=Parachaetomium inaequale TaxID=2588326 RepID=A0AAN6PAR3_9PEZI|nr:kinase-like domain-containing protein [Parachaetomium inaequale]
MSQAAAETSLPDTLTNEMIASRERLGDPLLSHVWRWDARTVVKLTDAASTSAEAVALAFVHERTSIPVPRLLKLAEQDGQGTIFMEFIDGQPLDEAWPSCTAAQRSHIISQLRGFLAELRAITGEFIGSVDRSVCNDQVFANRASAYGPYADEAAFRVGIGQSLRACDADPTWTELVIGFVEAMPLHHEEPPVMTHGDLVPRNILVKDGHVVGIVDWEMAGFYPPYWEYVKGHLLADFEHPWMQERVLDQILLTPYPIELGLLFHTRKILMY